MVPCVTRLAHVSLVQEVARACRRKLEELEERERKKKEKAEKVWILCMHDGLVERSGAAMAQSHCYAVLRR